MESQNTYPDLSVVLEALSVLVVPQKASGDVPFNLDAVLCSSIERLTDLLKTSVKFSGLVSTLLNVHLGDIDEENDLKIQLSETDDQVEHESSKDVRWEFATWNLLMLKTLNLSLNQAIHIQNTGEKQPTQSKNVPVASPDTLSFEQQKLVTTSIEFVVCLGVCPCLQTGVGIPIERRSGFAQLLQNSAALQVDPIKNDKRLLTCVRILLECSQQASLAPIVLTKYLGDLLAALLQLVNSDKTIVETSDKSRHAQCKKQDEKLSSDTISENQSKEFTETAKVESCGRPSEDKSTENISSTSVTRCENASVAPSPLAESAENLAFDKTTSTDSATTKFPKASSSCAEDGTNEARVGHGNYQLQSAKAWCKEELGKLVERAPKSVLVRQLLMLGVAASPPKQAQHASMNKSLVVQAPRWLSRSCGHLLSDQLTRPLGVQSVVLAFLKSPDGGEDQDDVDWRQCNAAARIVAMVPRQIRAGEDYFTAVCPQILDMLHAKGTMGRVLAKVAVTTTSLMLQQNRVMTEKHLIQKLLNPLTTTLEGGSSSQSGEMLVPENSIPTCVQSLHKLLSLSNGESLERLVKHVLPYIQPLFKLYCFVKSGVAPVKSVLLKLLVLLLNHTEDDVSLGVLEVLVFGSSVNSQGKTELHTMHRNLSYAWGPNGGIILSRAEPTGSPVGESDCVMEILEQLKNKAPIASFFLLLLKELSEMLKSEAGHQSTRWQPDTGILLTEEDRNELRMQHNLKVLGLLSDMSDKFGPSCLTRTSDIVQFVKITLERGVSVFQQTDDTMTEMFESETLTMAMGLLTAIMSDAKKLSDSEKQDLKQLVPLLGDIADNHPEESVREMAADLKIAIATHGYVLSDMLKEKQKNQAERKDAKIEVDQNVLNENISFEVKPVKKPLIEVISSTDTHPLSENVDDNMETKAATNENKNQDTILQSNTKFDSENTTITKDTESGSSSEEKSSETIPEAPIIPSSTLEEAFEELCDPLIPVRGHALITLRRLVESRDKTALDKKETILQIFKENVGHGDSYLYLAAIQGLSALGEHFPTDVLPVIQEEYRTQTDSKNKRSSEVRMKLGEVFMRVVRSLGDMVPHYRDSLLKTVLIGVRDEDSLIRASSLSNLAEICRFLHFSLGNVLHEVLECVSSLLQGDKEVEVRRSAALVITQLLQGLGQDIVKVLGSSVKDLYRLLKLVKSTDHDEGVQLHVDMALQELDIFMRQNLFPKQELTKKIRVLDPE